MRVPIFVSSWRIECCWEPPAVGQVRDWSLWFRQDAEMQPLHPADSLAHLAASVDASPYETLDSPVQGPNAVVLRLGELSMHWEPLEQVAAGPLQVSGWVLQEHHGGVPDDLPVSRAEVLEVHVENRDYVPESPGSRTWTIADSPPRYRSVERSPKWFTQTERTTDRQEHETGVVVIVDSGPRA